MSRNEQETVRNADMDFSALDMELAQMAEETPEVPADFHARWTQAVRNEAENRQREEAPDGMNKTEQRKAEARRQRRYLLSAAAAFIVVIGIAILVQKNPGGLFNRGNMIAAPVTAGQTADNASPAGEPAQPASAQEAAAQAQASENAAPEAAKSAKAGSAGEAGGAGETSGAWKGGSAGEAGEARESGSAGEASGAWKGGSAGEAGEARETAATAAEEPVYEAAEADYMAEAEYYVDAEESYEGEEAYPDAAYEDDIDGEESAAAGSQYSGSAEDGMTLAAMFQAAEDAGGENADAAADIAEAPAAEAEEPPAGIPQPEAAVLPTPVPTAAPTAAPETPQPDTAAAEGTEEQAAAAPAPETQEPTEEVPSFLQRLWELILIITPWALGIVVVILFLVTYVIRGKQHKRKYPETDSAANGSGKRKGGA